MTASRVVAAAKATGQEQQNKEFFNK